MKTPVTTGRTIAAVTGWGHGVAGDGRDPTVYREGVQFGSGLCFFVF